MPDAIAKLEKDLKIVGLKGQIKQLQKAENIKAFDKKHPIFAKIGKVGSAGFKAGKSFLAPRQNQKSVKDVLQLGETPRKKALKSKIKAKQKKDPLDFIMRI